MESISKYFDGICAKRLSSVEIPKKFSRQHEFNGIHSFKEILGTDRKDFKAKFIYFCDEEDSMIQQEGDLTWYDARESHERRTEFRLYYKSSCNDVLDLARVGDLLLFAKCKSDIILLVIAPRYSTAEKQLLLLFGLTEFDEKFELRDTSSSKEELTFAKKYILSAIGIEEEDVLEDFLPKIVEKFGTKFPSTFEFARFARSTIKDISPIDDPDSTILSWIEREKLLFKTLEKHIVQQKLKEGFGASGNDVDEFIKFSLSVQNRRKSRAGFSFEHHLAAVFTVNSVAFSWKEKTENNYEPDFLFPNIDCYKNGNFDSEKLTMLAVKSTVKERWRQILSEANRIWPKHLITLEPAISQNQTDQMKKEKVQLIIPLQIKDTYSLKQQEEIITLSEFISEVKEKAKYYN